MTGAAETTSSGDAPPAAEPGRAGEPDVFRLRGEPPRVMRLSRKTLAGIGAVGGAAIGGALLFALQSPSPKTAENLYATGNISRAEAVNGAAVDYGRVPKLGPPLPGDLGRPIVSAQRDGDRVPVPPMGSAPPAGARSPVDEARERARQEADAAKASRLFLTAGGTSAPVSDILRAGVEQPAAAVPASGAAPVPPMSAQRAFLESGTRRPFESIERIQTPSSPFILQSGSVIPAALISGIRSDLPGQVTAQVTQNVYDSPTGKILLIPQGARLVGEYDNAVAAGQQRLLLAWDRLILPGGRSIRLDRQPGTDAAGMAGLSDRTDYHWGRMLRAALVSTLLGVGTELASDRDDSLFRALRDGSQDMVNQAGQRLVEREMNIAPTLTIRPGYPLRVLVTRDLIVEAEAEAVR